MYVVRVKRLESAGGIDALDPSFHTQGVGLAFESKNLRLLNTVKVESFSRVVFSIPLLNLVLSCPGSRCLH